MIIKNNITINGIFDGNFILGFVLVIYSYAGNLFIFFFGNFRII
jgi:hypothetical protein